MNKLLLKSDDEIDNLVVEKDTELELNLNNCSKKINIIIENNTCLNLLDMCNKTSNIIEITLKERSILIYNKAGIDINDSILVNLDGYESSLDIYTSIVNKDKTNSFFTIRHNNSNTSSFLSNHGVNVSKNELKFNVDVIINQNANNSKTNQQNKIINLNNGKSNISPNLIVDNDNIDASHSAYISDFDEETIFYMKSRGINDKNIKMLLMDSFLIGNLKEEYRELIQEHFKNII
ncbi:MAG: SufD family Fe-S cluster assembly protein [bacterium]|nr:SufD family Fe-S cluster assembly protein [bacterium]